MNFDLTEDQREIKRTAREFLASRYTPEKIRAIALDGEPGPEGSLGKWLWADVNQGLTTLAMDVKGPRAQLIDDAWTYRYLRARANSIEGGTTEILRNIVAERVLGLPRA